MREELTIDSISRSVVGAELFDELSRVFSEGRSITASGEGYLWTIGVVEWKEARTWA